jgi:hypothetical protein
MYARSVRPAEIIRRLNLHMPIHLDGLIDPLGNEFSIHRENLMALLTTDIDALPFDSQSLAPLFMEVARVQRSCEWAAEQLTIRYVQWKAAKAKECREKADKKPTVAEVEEYYRTHEEYEEMASAPKSLEALGRLFADAKEAFAMKARAQEKQFRLVAGHEQALRFDDQQERLDTLADLDDSAVAQTVANSGSAQAAAAYLAKLRTKE